MKKRFKTAATGFIVCMLCVSMSPVSIFADDMTGGSETNTVQTGDTITVQDQTKPSGGITGGSSNSNTEYTEENTTGGAQGETSDTHVPTEEELAWNEVGNAASDVNSIYQQLLDKINSMFQQGTTGFGEGSQPNLNLIGWQFPSESWLDDINGLVSEYDSAYDNFTSVVNENGKYVSSAAASDLLAYDKNNPPAETGFVNGSGNIIIPSEIDDGTDWMAMLTDEERQKLWDQLIAQLGVSMNTGNDTVFVNFPLSDIADSTSFLIRPDGMIWNGSYSSLIQQADTVTDIRDDIFGGGVNLPSSGFEIADILNSYGSNSLWNWCNLISLTNYHISNVTETTVNIESYDENDNTRYWFVYYNDELVGSYTTTNDDHIFNYTPEWAGQYEIRCYRNAYYTTQKIVTLDQYNYLVDAAGRNILYFDETKGAIQIDVGNGEVQGPDIVPTGDNWVYNVVDGDVPKTGNTTQRVE